MCRASGLVSANPRQMFTSSRKVVTLGQTTAGTHVRKSCNGWYQESAGNCFHSHRFHMSNGGHFAYVCSPGYADDIQNRITKTAGRGASTSPRAGGKIVEVLLYKII